MPDKNAHADRSHGGPGSSHEDGAKQSDRTRKGDRIQPQSESINAPHDGAAHGDKHGSHAADDQNAKNNRKAEQGDKP